MCLQTRTSQIIKRQTSNGKEPLSLGIRYLSGCLALIENGRVDKCIEFWFRRYYREEDALVQKNGSCTYIYVLIWYMFDLLCTWTHIYEKDTARL